MNFVLFDTGVSEVFVHGEFFTWQQIGDLCDVGNGGALSFIRLVGGLDQVVTVHFSTSGDLFGESRKPSI